MIKPLTKRKRAQRDEKIHAHYKRLLSKPGAMASACDLLISKLYGISRSTVHSINRRVKQRTAQASTD